MEETASPERERLALVLAALASPTRLGLLERLAIPACVPDLVKELGLTRQAVRKHLGVLQAAGLVRTTRARRGSLPALRYAADPGALFLARERLRQVVPAGAALEERRTPTLAEDDAAVPDRPRG
ncbi:MAG TPA: winged helix-turn-helix domain-containing protein, partial [Candidatus Thermoplasmatota archaeon]|nr:winged helix-turn-helix domain-containing protein [Candidatus Thermoplasmatota archaeon]